jgi:hypothetical protein
VVRSLNLVAVVAGGFMRLNWCVGSWMVDSIILIDETPSFRLLLTAIVYVVTV